MELLRREGAERTAFPRCPVCGEETDTLYRGQAGEIVGCDGCLDRIDAWEALWRSGEAGERIGLLA